MHGHFGNEAREKTALMPNPLWRSSCRFELLAFGVASLALHVVLW